MTRLRLDPGNSPFDLKSDDLQTVCNWLMASAVKRLVDALKKARISNRFDDNRLRRVLLPVRTWMIVYLNTHAYAAVDLKARGQERIHSHPLIVNLRADLAVMEDAIYMALVAEVHDDTRGLVPTDTRREAADYARINWWRAFESECPFG